MRLITLLIFFCFCHELLSQDSKIQCEWFNNILNTKEMAFKLKIAKSNFREYSGIDKDDPCRILYCIAINDRYFTLTEESSIYFRFPGEMINAAKLDELDSIRVFDRYESNRLYGSDCDGVILIQSSSMEYERRLDSIMFRRN